MVCNSQQLTQKTQQLTPKSVFVKKSAYFFSGTFLFPTLTQWHSVHHLRILPVQTRERLTRNSIASVPNCDQLLRYMSHVRQMSATLDTKKRSSRNCMVFFRNPFSRSLSGTMCIFCEKICTIQLAVFEKQHYRLSLFWASSEW